MPADKKGSAGPLTPHSDFLEPLPASCRSHGNPPVLRAASRHKAQWDFCKHFLNRWDNKGTMRSCVLQLATPPASAVFVNTAETLHSILSCCTRLSDCRKPKQCLRPGQPCPEHFRGRNFSNQGRSHNTTSKNKEKGHQLKTH